MMNFSRHHVRRLSVLESVAIPPQPLLDRTASSFSLTATVESSQSEEDAASVSDEHRTPSWHPFWLRQTTLAVFSGVFFVLMGVPAAFMYYAERNNGIVDTRSNLFYLWRFGPPAVVSLLSIFWARVELQILRYKSWMAMEAENRLDPLDYTLDYTALIVPNVLRQSLKRKHYMVFFVTLTSILLKIQIVLSTNMLDLASVQVERPVSVQILDSFAVDNDNITTATSSRGHYFAQAAKYFNMQLPFGVDQLAAYQTFTVRGDDQEETRGTIDSPITVEVDGLFTDLTCRQLDSFTPHSSSYGDLYESFNVTLKFDDCTETLIQDGIVDVAYDSSESVGIEGPVNPGSKCSLPQLQPSFIYWAFSYKKGGPSRVRLDTCVALLCTPAAWVSRVQVVDDGISPNVTVLEDSGKPKVFVKSDVWSVWANTKPLYFSQTISGSRPMPSDAKPFFDEPEADSARYMTKLLESIEDMSARIGPMTAHYEFREVEESQTTGRRTKAVDRLQMSLSVAITMAVLFLVCMCISVATLVHSRKSFRVWHRDPATVLGTMMFFQKGGSHSTACLGTMSNSLPAMRAAWKKSHHSKPPMILQTWSRISITILTTGLIVSLLVTLEQSDALDGLVPVGERLYNSFLWTSIPALAMLIVAMCASTTDAAVRGLVQISALTQRPCNAAEVDISLLDMLGLRSLYYSIRLGIPAVTLTQTIAILCGFLTALSSVLFSPETVFETEVRPMQQLSWFGQRTDASREREPAQGRDAVGALLVASNEFNITYPRDTYADLVFPSFDLDTTGHDDSVMVEIKTPALRMSEDCALLTPEDDFTVRVEKTLGLGPGYMLNISAKNICPDENIGEWYSQSYETSPERPYFGHGVSMATCTPPSRVYVWGRASVDELEVSHMTAWRCNYTWLEVMTTVTLASVAGELQIEPGAPPVADMSTARPLGKDLGIGLWEMESNTQGEFDDREVFPSGLNPDQQLEGLSAQLQSLMEPIGPLRLSDLTDAGRSAYVLEVMSDNTRLAFAQIANIENRLYLNESAKELPEYHNDPPIVDGTFTRERERRRLVQDPIITYVMVGILSAATAVNLWALVSLFLKSRGWKPRAWLLDLELKGVAPEGHNTVGMMAALLRGVDYSRHIPEDADRMPQSQLHDMLAKKTFQMGWRFDDRTRQPERTIVVSEAAMYKIEDDSS